jgi:predicted O-methyltransferase YrrM
VSGVEEEPRVTPPRHAHLGRRFGEKLVWWLDAPYSEEMFRSLRRLAPDPRVAVELGSNVGRWARRVLALYPRLERLYCVDLWQEGEEFRGWCKACASDPRATPVRMSTNRASELSVFQGEPTIDLLYVDASHRRPDVVEDLRRWVPKVRPGGLVLLDDYQFPAVREALEDYRRLRPDLPEVHVEQWGGDRKNQGKQAWFLA